MMSFGSSALLVDRVQNGLIEARFRGWAIAVDPNGQIIARIGSPPIATFLRSAAKPFQTMALVCHPESGDLGLKPDEIAIMSGSHNGEPQHVEVIAKLMDRFGISSSALRCGLHPPLAGGAEISTKRIGGLIASKLQNNCAGTHIGLILLSRLLGADETNYWKASAPAQQWVRSILERLLNGGAESDVGLDSCGIPTQSARLCALARAYARFAHGTNLDDLADAAGMVRDCMTAYPFHIAGTARLETQLMQVAPVVAKIGANGLYCIAHLDSGMAVSVKAESGSVEAAKVAAVELIVRLGILRPDEESSLAPFRRKVLRAQDGRPCSVLVPVLDPKLD